MEYGHIFFPLVLSVLLFASAYIYHLRGKQTLLNIPGKSSDGFQKITEWFQLHMGVYSSSMSVGTYFGIAIISVVCIFAGMIILGLSMSLAGLCSLIGLIIPEISLSIYKGRLEKKFEDRYARALQQFASSLRAGMTILQAVENVCDCPFVHESIRDSFRQVHTDLLVGINIKTAFTKAADKLKSVDATDVAISISLQEKVGGNEAQVIETIARNISGRILLRREIKSLFADTSITILMMDVVPLLIIFALCVGSPEYIAPFFETLEMRLLFFGILAFTLFGSVVIRKTVKKGMGG